MKRVVIIVFITIILISSVFLINNLLKYSFAKEENLTLTKYNLIKENNIFKEYILEENDYYYFYIKENQIKYMDHNMNINDTLVIENINLINNFAIYGNNLIFSYNEIDNYKSGLIIYNLNDYTYNIIDVLNGMYIDFNLSIPEYMEDGINISLTLVNEDKFIKDNSNICEYDDKSIYIGEDVIFNYHQEEDEFLSNYIDTLLSLDSYIILNNYCN